VLSALLGKTGAMGSQLLSAIIGVGTGVAVVVLLQNWPTRYHWPKTISLTQGELSGKPIYRVRLGRRPRRKAKGRTIVPGRRPGRAGPIDVTIHARVAVKGLGTRKDTEITVPLPVDKPWRPTVTGGVMTTLLPQYVEPHELRYFPQEIRDKRDQGTLRLEDFLSLPGSRLRLYAFGYRPRTGTRLMIREFFGLDAIVPGIYRDGQVERSEDGKPPLRPDLIVPAWAATDRDPAGHKALDLGPWRIEIRRRDKPSTGSSGLARSTYLQDGE
jgi:hypothetical protein